MENNFIVCHKCGTQNESEYEYCKNCGAALKTEKTNDEPHYRNAYNNQAYSNHAYTNQAYGYNTYNQNFVLETIEGVPSEDVATFIGKKSYEIIPKFTKMEITASKTSWCWPAAILGFLFGPLGSAIWFFYRKMYKIALIFAAIGVITGAAVSLISGPLVDNEVLQNAKDNFYNGDYQSFYDAIDEALSSNDTVRSNIADTVESAVNIASMIVAGIFGFYWYKKHCVNSINRYRNMSVDPRYYKIGLASIGGSSSGMAVLGVAIMILAEDILSLIMFLV